MNGDAAPGLIIKETCLDAADQSVTYNSVLCIRALQDGAPIKVYAAMYRYPLDGCDGGAYDHTYTFCSFDSLLRGKEEVLERHTISYDADI